MFDHVKFFTIAALLRIVYGVLSFTWRVEEKDRPSVSGTCVYAHWHGDELALIGPFSRQGVAVLVSRSRDGQVLNLLLRWLGYRVVRGSSSKGGVEGLKGLIDELRQHKQGAASLAVDGPRGPRGVVKPGVLKLAELTTSSIVPGVAICRRAYVFRRSWNQAFLPLPFAKIRIQYGEPIIVPEGLSKNALEEVRQKLEARLRELKTL